MTRQMTIEEIGELARKEKPSADDLANRRMSIACGLRPHDSKHTSHPLKPELTTANGTLLALGRSDLK